MLYGASLLANEDLGNRFMVAYLMGVRQYEQGKTDRNLEILTTALNEEEDMLRAMCWQAIRLNGEINGESVLDFQDWAVGRGYVENPVTLEQIWEPGFVDHAVGVLGAEE
jgi:NitT/TauT family transport system substrate-binding protein